ncbi:hypothetical protein O1611_g6307 [Lasiodiplodia mahajangana]|uniref:Uncharacterized protein n=1 Tax=Lasiodiplodia mahajangana TaxID=1108764 RepID=A0ACC2JIZ1_9PEZI|nr:hypothetical protein O1611_g6307 [Lasiodiplodia mahajangana]
MRYLPQANNNSVEDATNDYLDDPKGTKHRWDESHFNTDREGGANEPGISFNIQGPDELPSVSYVNSVAPTRPPSRANNRSPLVLISGAKAPTNPTQEDADLARAIAESAAESGITQQETGVIDHETTSKYFGPANRPEYDSEMWAMVPTKASVEVDATDPPASNRKRDIDAPAFLRQTKNHRIGALLSIYTKIPLARNFLLRCGRQAPTYGHNTEWWKGKPILRQDVLAKMARGEEIWGEDARPDFVDELHRLVAFLDMSERSYANVDNLAETKAIDPSFDSWASDIEGSLFAALRDIGLATPGSGVENMMTTGEITRVVPPPDDQFETDEQNEEEINSPFFFLDLELDEDNYTWVNTMYDALDHLLWSDALSSDRAFPDDTTMAVLLKPAEVLTLRFAGPGLTRPCEIPAVFYADRYMNSRKDLAVHFQAQIREIKSALKKLARMEEEQTNCTGELCHFSLQGFNYRHDVRECSSEMIAYAERLLDRQKKNAQWRQFQEQWQKGTPYSMDDLRLIHTWSGPSDFTDDEKVDQEKWEHIKRTCTNKVDETGRVLQECMRKREELNTYLDVVRKRLTCQEHEADDDQFVFRSSSDAYRPEYWNPSTKYFLRGVAPTAEVAYVCVRDIDDSASLGENSRARDQWWKIGYVKSDASPIKSEKMTLDDVLNAAGTDSRNPILVYASEAALNQKKISLSDALRMFVKADNRSFQQELAQEISVHENKSGQDVQMADQPSVGITAAALAQISPEAGGERKHSIGSSVATNGSVRSTLADVELVFDDSQMILDEVSEPMHQDISPQSSMIDSIVEPINRRQAHEHETPRYIENEEGNFSGGQEDGDNLGENTASPHKMPEMSERKGGANPFLARPGNSARTPIDTMDMETQHGVVDG